MFLKAVLIVRIAVTTYSQLMRYKAAHYPPAVARHDANTLDLNC